MDPKHVLLAFRGRITRKEYWFGVTGTAVVALAGFAAFYVILFLTGSIHSDLILFALALLVLTPVLALWPFLAVHIKRLHDRDRSGWWVLIWNIPLVAWILGDSQVGAAALGGAIGLWTIIDLGLGRGTAGPNRFGNDPHVEA